MQPMVDEPEGPGYAEAVRAAREASGREPGELAAALDISWAAYWDIESYDDEITSVISFAQAVKLADIIDLDLRRLFGAGDGLLTFDELAGAVRARVRDSTLEQVEDELGWELAEPLARPAAFADLPLDALVDIAGPLGLDWRHLLPRCGARRATHS
jgi:hypothetical protein